MNLTPNSNYGKSKNGSEIQKKTSYHGAMVYYKYIYTSYHGIHSLWHVKIDPSRN